VLTQVVTAKFKRAAGFLKTRKSTAAIIALTQRRRGPEETAVAVIRTADDADDRVVQIPLFVMIETRDALIALASYLRVQPKARQPGIGNLKRVSADER